MRRQHIAYTWIAWVGLALVPCLATVGFATTGPVGHWELDESSGTVAPDSAGAANGTLLGNPVWATDDTRGRVLDLDGSGDAVRLPNQSALNPQRITVMAWIKTEAEGSSATHVITKDDSIHPRQRVWQFRVSGSNRIQFIIFDTAGTPVTATGTTDLGDNQWHHVTGTWDGTTIRVFVDGVQDGAKAHSGSLQAGQTNDAFIGRSETQHAGYFTGRIDDARLYDRALSPQEIHDAMVGSVPSDPVGDVCHVASSYWPLEQAGSASEIIDACGTNDGDFLGGTAWTVDAQRGTVLDLNGVNSAVRLPNQASLNPSHLTLSAWIKTAAPGTSADHIVTKDAVSGGRVWQFRVSGSNRLQFIVFSTSSLATATGSTNLGDNQWHHVAGTWDGTTIRVYVDGELDGTAALSGTLRAGQSNDAFIGRSQTTNPGYYDGLVDDVFIFGQALAEDKIEALANDDLETLAAPSISPTWQDFVDSRTSGDVPIVPNFSYSGYRYSEVEPPHVTGPIFPITSYGAIAGDGQSDRNAIQAAVDAAKNAGGGMVYFPPGVFHLNTSAGSEATILIQTDGIVLRGSGSEGAPTGTTLVMPHHNDLAISNRQDSAPFAIQFKPSDTSAPSLAQITADADRDSYSVTVDTTANLSVGDWVTVYYKSCTHNEQNCHEDPGFEHYLSPYVADTPVPCPAPPEPCTWARAIEIKERHKIAAIHGNVVTFDAPLQIEIDLSVLESAESWRLLRYRHLEEVGIEDLFFEGGLTEPFKHHQKTMTGASFDSGWSAVFFESAVQCWARRLRFRNWSQGLQFFDSSACSTLNVTFVGNPGHFTIHSRGGTGNLIGLSHDLTGSWHGPSVGYGSASTVFWRYQYPGNSSPDPHSSSPYATLLDLSRGGIQYERAGGPHKGMPNHLRHFVFWNFEHRGPGTAAFDFWNVNPRTYFVKPILVGFHLGEDSFGVTPSFESGSVDIDESNGIPVDPGSLFEAQLNLRLGSLPTWLKNLCNCGN